MSYFLYFTPPAWDTKPCVIQDDSSFLPPSLFSDPREGSHGAGHHWGRQPVAFQLQQHPKWQETNFCDQQTTVPRQDQRVPLNVIIPPMSGTVIFILMCCHLSPRAFSFWRQTSSEQCIWQDRIALGEIPQPTAVTPRAFIIYLSHWKRLHTFHDNRPCWTDT